MSLAEILIQIITNTKILVYVLNSVHIMQKFTECPKSLTYAYASIPARHRVDKGRAKKATVFFSPGNESPMEVGLLLGGHHHQHLPRHQDCSHGGVS